jgi:hypothetical protein
MVSSDKCNVDASATPTHEIGGKLGGQEHEYDICNKVISNLR